MKTTVGKIFGKYEVQGVNHTVRTSGGQSVHVLDVKCLGCGTIYQRRDSTIRNNVSGCRACTKAAHSKRTEAGYGHPRYAQWRSMLDRCYNPDTPMYKHYGGRGIFVCDRWRGWCANGERGTLDGFQNFVKDMGDKPSSKHSLDRINNDGPYSPENCRWATWVEQASNRRDNVWLVVGEERKILAEWERDLGIIGLLGKAATYGVLPETVVRLVREGKTAPDLRDLFTKKPAPADMRVAAAEYRQVVKRRSIERTKHFTKLLDRVFEDVDWETINDLLGGPTKPTL